MDEKWFKRRQKERGITAEDIAQKLGRARSNVSHILNGHQRMNLEWAKAFAEALDVPLATVLEKAGITEAPVVQQLTPGFAESDAMAWVPGPGIGEGEQVRSIAQVLGATAPGIDVWRVKSQAMALAGMLTGDFFLLDTHKSERAKAGDMVVAQIYSNSTGTATTVLRRFEPPVLVAASTDPSEQRVHVVDGQNVVIKGKVVASWRV